MQDTRDEYYLIPDYQNLVGQLTEFDPGSLLSAVCEDVNKMLNYVLMLREDNEEIPTMMESTMQYIHREMAERKVILTQEQALEYGRLVGQLVRAYIRAITSTFFWFTRHAQWVGARYTGDGSGGVEFILRYGVVKLPEYEDPAVVRALSPEVSTKLDLLAGRLGASL